MGSGVHITQLPQQARPLPPGTVHSPRPIQAQHSSTLPPPFAVNTNSPKDTIHNKPQPVRHGYSLSDNPVPRLTSDSESTRDRSHERERRVRAAAGAEPARRRFVSAANINGDAGDTSSQGSGTNSPRIAPLGSPGLPPSINEDSETAPRSPPTKYETFAEMGFKSQKLEDKECIIM